MIVDLTDDKEDEHAAQQNLLEQSDYELALMMSQQDTKVTNDEVKERIDQESADFQMALRLSQQETENSPKYKCRKQDHSCTPSKSFAAYHETECHLSPVLSDLPDITNINCMEEKSLNKIESACMNDLGSFDNLVLSSQHGNDTSLTKFLNEVKDDSLIWRDQSCDKPSLLNSIVITPPRSESASNVVTKNDIEAKAPKRTSNSAAKDSNRNRQTHQLSPRGSSDEDYIDNHSNRNSPDIGSMTSHVSKSKEGSNKKRKRTSITSEISTGSDKSTNAKSKKYLPKPGSGGYAILIALFYNESSANYKGYLTKDELIDAAQPFANQSMRFSQPGTQFSYNGYSASSILAKKELIIKSGKPHKIRYVIANYFKRIGIFDLYLGWDLYFPDIFSFIRRLTDEGRKMAEALVAAREEAESYVGNDLSIIGTNKKTMGETSGSEVDTTKSKNSLNREISTNYISSSNICPPPNNSLHVSPKDKTTSAKNEVSFEDPSWLEGLLQSDMETSSKVENYPTMPSSPSRERCKGSLSYCYISDTGESSNNQNDAELDIDEVVYYLIGCSLGK